MNFTPEGLVQIYMGGVLTDEAQKTFDDWMAKDPAFSQALIQAVKAHLGPVPDLKFVEARLDAQADILWTNNKPSFPQILLKKYPKRLAGLAVALLLSWALIHWGAEVQRSLKAALHLGPPATQVAPVITRPVLAKPHKRSVIKRSQIPNDVTIDYVDHNLQIVINSDKKQKAAITILDAKGQIVCRVYQGPWTAGHHVLTWTGKNDMGALVTPGKYTVVVQANGQTTSGVINFPDF